MAEQQTRAEEKSAMLIFCGWKIDAFITQSGRLGLTIEACKDSSRIVDDENPSVDLFVDHNLQVKVMSPDAAQIAFERLRKGWERELADGKFSSPVIIEVVKRLRYDSVGREGMFRAQGLSYDLSMDKPCVKLSDALRYVRGLCPQQTT